MAVKDQVEALLQPVIEDLGYEFVGLELNPHASNGMLRIYIDEPEQGVGLEDCERVSREVSAQLDVHDPIKGQYNLEISSPGMDRPLFTLEHFERFSGEVVALSALAPVEGRRKFKARIVGVDDGTVVLDQDGTEYRVPHANVAKARLVPEFE
ncbi:MAG: ribosome maturation factor RimP [Pseudomonadota bacterium]